MKNFFLPFVNAKHIEMYKTLHKMLCGDQLQSKTKTQAQLERITFKIAIIHLLIIITNYLGLWWNLA